MCALVRSVKFFALARTHTIHISISIRVHAYNRILRGFCPSASLDLGVVPLESASKMRSSCTLVSFYLVDPNVPYIKLSLSHTHNSAGRPGVTAQHNTYTPS